MIEYCKNFKVDRIWIFEAKKSKTIATSLIVKLYWKQLTEAGKKFKRIADKHEINDSTCCRYRVTFNTTDHMGIWIIQSTNT